MNVLRVATATSSSATATLLKHTRQCTYNVVFRRVRVTTVAVENHKYYIFWACVCSLRYPAWNVHLSYCHLWPVRLYNTVLHYLIKGTIFEFKKVTKHEMCFLIFSITFVCNISYSKKNSASYNHKCILVFMQSTCYSCQTVKKLRLDWLSKILEYQISRKSVQWQQSCSMGTDGQT